MNNIKKLYDVIVVEKMIILVALIVILSVPNINGSIQCFKCSLTKSGNPGEPTRLCSEFDYSDKFIVDCPYSTFCMKKSFSAKISNQINATERDCASQKYVTQNFKDERWQQEIYIQEPYSEGCTLVDNKGLRTPTLDCYCKGYLCNSANYLTGRFSLTILIIAVIIFNLL